MAILPASHIPTSSARRPFTTAEVSAQLGIAVSKNPETSAEPNPMSNSCPCQTGLAKPDHGKSDIFRVVIIQQNMINGPYIAAARKKGLKALLQIGASDQFLLIDDIAIDIIIDLNNFFS
jgi:hypothetical protein